MKRLLSQGRAAARPLLVTAALVAALAAPGGAAAQRRPPSPAGAADAGAADAGRRPTDAGAATPAPTSAPTTAPASPPADAGPPPPADAGAPPPSDAGEPSDAAVPELPPPPRPARRPTAPKANAAAEPAPPEPAPVTGPTTPPQQVETQAEAPVRLLDRTVFVIRVPRGSQSTDARARAAARVLERAAQEAQIPEVRVDERDDVAVVYVGESPLVQLGPEDAEAAGDASLGVHAATVASRVRDTLAREQSRSRAAKAVFSVSILVFSGLIAVLLLRKLGEIVSRMRAWLDEHPERLPALRLGGIEVLRPAAFKGALSVALGAARVLAQIGVAITWCVFSLSLFDATQGLSQRLTGYVLAPISALVGRMASSVPVLAIALVAMLAVLLLVRFVGLFFGSVARGETAIGWLPADLAAPTGVLVRGGIVVAALVFAAPLVTGVEEGALARAGVVVLVSLGLSATPVLASAAVGVAVVYGRRVKVGEMVELGGRAGRVREISLLEVRLDDEDGCHLRVPHLLTLVHPTRILGKHPLVAIEISVAPGADLARAREILVSAAAGLGSRARASMVGLDDGGAHFRATMHSDTRDARGRWLAGVAAALAAASIPLGRPPARVAPSRSVQP